MSPTAAELREALASWGPFDPAFPIEDGLTHRQRMALAVATRLLADILEQAEEMDWCKEHNASGGVSCWAWVYGNAADDPLEKPCRMVPSLRIPSAVLVKNEEG